MLIQLPREFIDQKMDGGLYIIRLRSRVQFTSVEMHRRFGNLLNFLHLQNNINLINAIEKLFQL